MFAVVCLIPNANNITLAEASNDNKIILQSFFLKVGKCLKENGIKKMKKTDH